MIARVSTVAFQGIAAVPVDVQAQFVSGQVTFSIVYTSIPNCSAATPRNPTPDTGGTAPHECVDCLFRFCRQNIRLLHTPRPQPCERLAIGPVSLPLPTQHFRPVSFVVVVTLP